MEDASGVNLDQFQLWYEQSGTPKIQIKRDYDQSRQSLVLDIIQDPGETHGKPNQAFHLPLKISLFDPQGRAIKLDAEGSLEHTVDLRETRQQLKFDNINARPVGFGVAWIFGAGAAGNRFARR